MPRVNLIRYVPFRLLVHVTSASGLPQCPGSYDENTWHNCEGIDRLRKYFTKAAIPQRTTETISTAFTEGAGA